MGGQQQEVGGKLQEEGAKLVDNNVASSLGQVTAPDNVGFFVVQGEDGRLDGEKEMDVDGFSVG